MRDTSVIIDVSVGKPSGTWRDLKLSNFNQKLGVVNWESEWGFLYLPLPDPRYSTASVFDYKGGRRGVSEPGREMKREVDKTGRIESRGEEREREREREKGERRWWIWEKGGREGRREREGGRERGMEGERRIHPVIWSTLPASKLHAICRCSAVESFNVRTLNQWWFGSTHYVTCVTSLTWLPHFFVCNVEKLEESGYEAMCASTLSWIIN